MYNKKMAAYWERHPWQQLVLIVVFAWWAVLLCWIFTECPKILWNWGIKECGRKFKMDVWDFIFSKSTYKIWKNK